MRSPFTGMWGLSGLGQASSLARYSIGGKAPAAVADFSAGAYGLNGAPVGFDGLFSFARLSAIWKMNALDHWVKVLAWEPRTGHHIWQGGKLVPAGIAVCSEVRTNLLLNSDTLSTQSVTVSAVKHTLSFTGTGTVTLSGAATDGPLFGMGTSEKNSVRMSFTPSAGSLTLTVSGDVQNAQLETGPYATDYISTQGAQVSTAAESLQIDPVELVHSVGTLGPELLGNTGFTAWADPTVPDGWTKTGTHNANNFVEQHENGIRIVSDGAFTGITQNTGISGPKLVGIEVVSISGVGVVVQFDGQSFFVQQPGTFYFVTTDPSPIFILKRWSGPTDVVVRLVTAREATMPEAMTMVMNGTMTRAKEPASYDNAVPFRWGEGAGNSIDLIVSTSGTAIGQPIFRNRIGGTLIGAVGTEDALALAVAEPFSMAFVLSATEIEGFYNGVSTGKTTHGGMANLLASPLQIFPVGSATLKDFRLWPEALPSADMLEVTT
ncbi:hypothetical protein [Pseudophaeobacter sp.]|uniref:hypothetical protein n=1 Tax=Pseudophaeobacter sp. TaxID=1971739 RepID=UPI00262735A9|nr:hypothetical protein [Pseudophaeobacter sp.]